LQADTLK